MARITRESFIKVLTAFSDQASDNNECDRANELMNSSSISITLKAKFLTFPLRAIAADVMTNT